jgi:hypothetical protein
MILKQMINSQISEIFMSSGRDIHFSHLEIRYSDFKLIEEICNKFFVLKNRFFLLILLFLSILHTIIIIIIIIIIIYIFIIFSAIYLFMYLLI